MAGAQPPRCAKILALACGALVSCAGGGADRGSPDAGGRTFALLSVTLTTARDGAATLGASARLLRYRGLDVESAQVLAGNPAAAREPAVFSSLGSGASCAVIDDEALLDDALATSPPDASVHMLDAGELLFQIAGQTVKIAPRYVPDIVPFVSGVVYDAEISAPFVDEAGGAVGEEAYIAAFGGQHIGRFLTAAEVPPPPRLSSVRGVRDSDLTVEWAGDPDGGPLQIALAGDFGPAVRCVVPDTGRFTIPAALTSRVADALRGEPMRLSIERSRRTPFSAPGIDAAEVEVVVRDAVPVR